MRVLINENDAKFLRGVIYSVVSNVSMPREMRRKFARINDKLSASRIMWGPQMKTKEVAFLSVLVANALKTLKKELDSTNITEHRKDMLKEAAVEAERVLNKLSDTLTQDQEDAPDAP